MLCSFENKEYIERENKKRDRSHIFSYCALLLHLDQANIASVFTVALLVCSAFKKMQNTVISGHFMIAL